MRILVILAALSSVYLLYLPHAMPVADDWVYLGLFEEPWLTYLHNLIDNTYNAQFRIHWAGLLPAFLLSLFAGASGWPYALLAWAAHLLTAALLFRLASSLAGDPATGFTAAALYAVLPTSNQVLFWSLGTSFYYMQALGLVWFLLHPRHRFLPAVLFLGEQSLLALLFLPPLSDDRAGFWRSWSIRVALAAALLTAYALLINRMPVAGSIQHRAGGVQWSLWPFLPRVLAALGTPGLASWRPAWRPDPFLAALLLMAAAALYYGVRVFRFQRRPHWRLLLWSCAGVLLTYLPVSWLALEWRYLYVPSLFLATAAAAVLGLLGSRLRTLLLFVAVAWSICITFQEMRQCWIPQSRVARALIDTLTSSGPYHAGEVVLFSGGPGPLGPAPNFITQADFSLRSVMDRYVPNQRLLGGRELTITDRGELVLYPPNALRPFTHADLDHLRIFSYRPEGRYERLSWIALPAPDGSVTLRPLLPNPGPPDLDKVYFPHRP